MSLYTEAHVLTHVLSLRGKQKQLKTGTGEKMPKDSSTVYLVRKCMPQRQACSKQWPSLVTARTETLLPIVTHRQQNWQHLTGASQTPAMVESF